MQAAFQEHVLATVSKPANLHREAEVADVERVYRLACQLGCKGITVNHDGCREGQVLSAGDGAGPVDAPDDEVDDGPRPAGPASRRAQPRRASPASAGEGLGQQPRQQLGGDRRPRLLRTDLPVLQELPKHLAGVLQRDPLGRVVGHAPQELALTIG
jgi:ribonucleotide reductase alpha subunit